MENRGMVESSREQSSSMLSPHCYGLMLCAVGTVWISPDNLLVVLVAELESTWVVLFYKNLFSLIAQSMIVWCLLGRRVQTCLDHVRRGGWLCFVGAVSYASVNLLLSMAFIETSSVNALLLFSLHTVWSALGGWFLLHDPLPPRTMVMVGVGLACALTVGLVPHPAEPAAAGDDRATAHGNAMAAGAGFGFAAQMLACRALRGNASPLPMTCFGSGLAALVALSGSWCSSLSHGDRDPFLVVRSPWPTLPLLLLDGGILVGVAVLLYSKSSQYLTATEILLVSLLEPLLGPLWVWLGTGQTPSPVSVIAGSVFLVCLVAHETLSLAEHRSSNDAAQSDSEERSHDADQPSEQSTQNKQETNFDATKTNA